MITQGRIFPTVAFACVLMLGSASTASALTTGVDSQCTNCFSEDPGVPCLGPDDPFCSGDGTGGGGTIQSCEKCATRLGFAQCCQGTTCDDLKQLGYTISSEAYIPGTCQAKTQVNGPDYCTGDKCG